MKTNLFSAIAKTALIAGTLDILAAFVEVYIKSGRFIPFAILKFIAGGIFGKEARSGGAFMIISGLIIHYCIASVFTIFFFWLFPKIKIAVRHDTVTGIVYGIFIWAIMNLLVLPMSAIPATPFRLADAWIDASILVVCLGIPISYMATRFYQKQGKQSAT